MKHYMYLCSDLRRKPRWDAHTDGAIWEAIECARVPMTRPLWLEAYWSRLDYNHLRTSWMAHLSHKSTHQVSALLKIFSHLLLYFTKIDSSVGLGRSVGTESPPPRPEIGKIVEENWCYLPGVYTFGEEVESQEIFSKNYENANFTSRFLSENFKMVLIYFIIIFILVPTHKT